MTLAADVRNHEADQPVAEAVFKVESAAGSMGGAVLSVIWKMIAKYQGRMWLSIALGIASALCTIIPPAAAAGITAALLNGDKDQALIWAFFMLAGAIATVFFYAASTMVSHYIAADVQRDQRRMIGEKLKSVPLGFFARLSPVDLRKLLVDDIEKLEDGVAHLIPEMTAAYVGPVTLFVVMFVVDWRLGLAAALPTVGGFIFMSIVMRDGVEKQNAFNNAQANIATTMGEVIKAIPVVKTYNNSDAALARAGRAVEAFSAVVNDFIVHSLVPANWFFLLATSNLVIVTPLSLYLLDAGSVGLPQVVFFHLAAMSMALLLSALFGVGNRLRLQEGVVARWQALVAQSELDFVDSGPVPAGADIRFEDIRFAYGEKTVIDGLSLEVPAGSSLALVGPSGSGKTTLARLLARFWDVQSGRVLIGGIDVREMTPQVLSNRLSFVFQDVFLFTRSVADNIRIGKLEATREEVIAAAKAAKADGFITALPKGYDTVVDSTLGLSLGQKQRISVARALLRDAPVLVLDEATAFSDPENEYEVQTAIGALSKDKTLIVIAHRLSTIQNADQIAFIEQGRVVELGTHSELLALGGAYAAQWQAHTAARSFKLSNRVGGEA
ncbi:MAG: ABC transporter ATP-binding protein [Pseudomonadota bacterium]